MDMEGAAAMVMGETMSELENEPTAPERPKRRRRSWGMSLSLPVKVLAEDELPEGLAEAGVYQTKKEAGERGLVVLSMKLGYWLFPASQNRWRLAVRSKHLEAVRAQLERYEGEQVVKPQPMNWPVQPTVWWLWSGWCAVLAGLHWLGGGGAGKLAEAGLFEGRRFFEEGQLWRALTAQTLHADLGHLAGNIFGILLFGWVAARGIGAGLAFAGSLLAGFLAFTLSGWIHFPHHYASLGASSTVFALLGVVTGQAVFSGWVLEWRGFAKSLLAPFLGGLAFLGMFGGAGTEGSEQLPTNTDLLAHLMGFAAGLPFGAAGGWLVWRGHAGVKEQFAGAALAVSCMAWAWGRAVS